VQQQEQQLPLVRQQAPAVVPLLLPELPVSCCIRQSQSPLLQLVLQLVLLLLQSLFPQPVFHH
jgi:hypothetical protein